MLVLNRDKKAYILQPAADVDLPCEWSEEKKRKISMVLANAPQLYGESLSDADREVLEQLKSLQKTDHLETKQTVSELCYV